MVTSDNNSHLPTLLHGVATITLTLQKPTNVGHALPEHVGGTFLEGEPQPKEQSRWARSALLSRMFSCIFTLLSKVTVKGD